MLPILNRLLDFKADREPIYDDAEQVILYAQGVAGVGNDVVSGVVSHSENPCISGLFGHLM